MALATVLVRIGDIGPAAGEAGVEQLEAARTAAGADEVAALARVCPEAPS